MTAKPICYAPFIAMYANPYGEFAPCCIAKKHKKPTANDYLASGELAGIRQQMLNGSWPEGCGICERKASLGLPNSTDAWEAAYRSIGSPDLSQPSIRFLDLRTSNLCNLKCRMCGPSSSSQWNGEVRDNESLRDWHAVVDEQVIDNIDGFLDLDLLQINLLGGEPTIDPIVLDVMRRLLHRGGRLPRIRFTTNATNLNRRFVDLMSGFDEVYVTFSVDGTGSTFEYIRTNASWKVVERNIRSVLDNPAIAHREFNTILMPYNIFNLRELLGWYAELESSGYRFRISFDNSESPITGLEAVLPHHIDEQCNLIERYLEKQCRLVDRIQGVSDLVGLLRSIRFDEKSHNAFKSFNNAVDRVRGTDISSLDPRLSSYR